MGDANNETQSLIIKIAIYAGGLILGITAKLADLYNRSILNAKTFVLHTTIALSCAWVVWGLLKYHGYEDVAPWVSPILGRFGDSIIMQFYEGIKTFIKNLSEKL